MEESLDHFNIHWRPSSYCCDIFNLKQASSDEFFNRALRTIVIIIDGLRALLRLSGLEIC